jgi:ABC-2 type transport system permease protein
MTFIFPVVLLIIFNGVFGKGHTTIDGIRVELKVFYVPGILTMAIVVTAYAGLVISISTLRETGALKRRRATPVPPAVPIASPALTTASGSRDRRSPRLPVPRSWARSRSPASAMPSRV